MIRILLIHVLFERYFSGMTTVRLREFGKTGTQMRQAKLSIVFILFLPIAIPQPVEYQPWAPDRPYDGGTKYNCMLLKVFFICPFVCCLHAIICDISFFTFLIPRYLENIGLIAYLCQFFRSFPLTLVIHKCMCQ